MPRIDLDLNSDLMVTDDGYLTLRISPDEDNALSIASDGLLSVGALSVSGWNSKSGQILEGLTIGQVSFYNKNPSNPSGRIATTGIIHRVFTSHGEKPGEELTGRFTKDYFRSDMDYCLPGDIFRVKIDNDDNYDYYLILKVDPRKEGDKYEPGNMIAQYVKLGTFGDLSEPEDEWKPVDAPDKPDTTDYIERTIGGSEVIAYEDLSQVQIGDRVVIKTRNQNWISDANSVGREISDWERECVWHVKEKVSSHSDISQIRKRTLQPSITGERLLGHHSKYAINVSGPSTVSTVGNRELLQYIVLIYKAREIILPFTEVEYEYTYMPELSTLEWKSASESTIIELDGIDAGFRVVIRNRDNSPIDATSNLYKISCDQWNPLTQQYDPYVTSDNLLPLQDGDLNIETGEEVNGGLDTEDPSTDAIPLKSHYEVLRYKPNAWNITYPTYYEYIAEHYEKIPDTVVTPPDFFERPYYKQTKGYVVVTDQPLNWSAPNMYKKFYEREYHREQIIYYGLENTDFEQGSIDYDTGEKITSDRHIRSKFSATFPPGKYSFYTEMRIANRPIQMNVYVYDASTGGYIPAQSSRQWSDQGIANHVITQESKIIIVIRDYDLSEITPADVTRTVDVQKYPSVSTNDYDVSEDNGYYVWYTYNPLTQPTPFVSGQFYALSDIYVQVMIKPDDWDVSFLNYYTREDGKYIPIPQSDVVPTFVVGKYYELVYDDEANSDTLVLEEEDRTVYLRDVYKAPEFGASNLEKDTLVRLSNAPYWDGGTPLWSFESEEVTRDLSDKMNPPEMTYSYGSIDSSSGNNLDEITYNECVRSEEFVTLAEDETHNTASDVFVLNAEGATHCALHVYTKNGEVIQYQAERSITDWRELPFRFAGFDDASICVRFVFKNDNETIDPVNIQNVTLTTETRTITKSEAFTDEEMFSIWYIKDETVDPDATTVTIARKRTATSEELVREDFPIKCLDLYQEVASIVELHVGEMVSIADNAPSWSDGTTINEQDRKIVTFMVIRRDLQSKMFTLNNGKSIERQYLIKLSRIVFNDGNNTNNATPSEVTPDEPVDPGDQTEPDDPGDGGDG